MFYIYLTLTLVYLSIIVAYAHVRINGDVMKHHRIWCTTGYISWIGMFYLIYLLGG
jgi:hypothetical protein